MTGDVIIKANSNHRRVKKTNNQLRPVISHLINSRSISRESYSAKEILLFGLSLMIIPFLPASNLFFPVGFVVAERVLYLPSMGFCMLVAYGAYRMVNTNTTVLPFLTRLGILLLLISHGAKTLYRTRDWYSKESLYKSLMKQYPTNGHIIGNLALGLYHAGDAATAEKLNRYAINVAPDVPSPFVNLGSLLKQQGRLDEAEQVRTGVSETHTPSTIYIAMLMS